MRIINSSNIGFVAVKTTFRGPYQPPGQDQVSNLVALEWVVEPEFISTAAQAMNNFQNLEEDIQAMPI